MLAEGTILGHRYEIVGVLSASGRSMMYTACDQQTGALCTIKVLELSDEQAFKRFHREAHIISKLQHPNISRLLDCRLHQEGISYLVTEYVTGEDMETFMVKDGPQEPQWAVPVFVQLCDALGYAHSAKVVHRNIKASKVILSGNLASPLAKLYDFGLAKPFQFEGGGMMDFTEAGVAVGTLLYMSPEQCRGQNADALTDIYSLGCLMYRVFTGKNPFEARSMPDLMRKQEKPPQKINKANPNMEIPEKLENIIMRCLDKNPGKRYQTAQQVRMALTGENDRKSVWQKIFAPK